MYLVDGRTTDAGVKYFIMRGCWIMKGHKLYCELNEDWNVDAPSFKFRRIEGADDIYHYVSNYFYGYDENGAEGDDYDELR